jgi:hypothetical protein
MNRLHGLWSLGSVVGGLAAAWTASVRLSLTAHLTVIALASGAVIIFVASGLLRQDEDHEHTPLHSPVDRPGSSPRALASPPRIALALLALGGAFAFVVEQTSSDWAAFRLADDLGTTAGFASLGFVAFTTGMTTARFGGDALHVRLGRRGLHRVALFLTVAGLAMATLVDDRWVVLGGYLIAGIGVATFLPELYDDAARMPGRRGAGLGAMTAGTRVAWLIAPAIVGLLAGTSLSVGSAVAIVTMPCAAGFGFVSAWSHGRSTG